MQHVLPRFGQAESGESVLAQRLRYGRRVLLYFALANAGDTAQAAGVWAAAVALLVLRETAPSIAGLRIVILLMAVHLVLFEVRSLLLDDRLVLRGKTLVLAAFFGYIFARPILGPEWMSEMPPSAVYTATAACVVFLALVLTAYQLARLGGRTERLLDKCVVELDFRHAFALLLACFLPRILINLFYQDWSTVSGVLSGMLGLERAPWRRGRFGDVRVLLAPIGWLYMLVPVVLPLCWARARRAPLRYAALVVIGGLFFLSILFQRSRYVLVTSALSVCLVGALLASRRSQRAKLYVVSVALVPILAIGANLILRNRTAGNFTGLFVGRGAKEPIELNANPLTVVEDNLPYFARATQVVPGTEGFRSPLELYYFMAINPIPRFMWHEKPHMSQEYLGDIRPYYAAMTVVGDLYVYGGWIHVVVGALVYGWMVKKVDGFGRKTIPPEGGRAIIYAALIWVLFGTVRALWNMVVASYGVIVLLVIMYFVRRRVWAERARKMALRRRS